MTGQFQSPFVRIPISSRLAYRLGDFNIALSLDTALGFDSNPAAQPQARGSHAALTRANLLAESD